MAEINIKDSTMEKLTAIAGLRGKSAEDFVPEMPDEIMEDIEDSLTYMWLLEHEPQGRILAEGDEKEAFESWPHCTYNHSGAKTEAYHRH